MVIASLRSLALVYEVVTCGVELVPVHRMTDMVRDDAALNNFYFVSNDTRNACDRK